MFKICLLILLPLVIAHPPGHVENTPENIERLNNLRPGERALYYSGQYQGDIVLTDEQAKALDTRTGLLNTRYRWPNNIVPYQFSSSISAAQRTFLRAALNQIEAVTCIRFVQRTNQADYVLVKNENSGCWSYVGRIGGAQSLNLQGTGTNNVCWWSDTVIHEFVHALGFHHMQGSPVRDNHVRNLWQNIQSGKAHNFEISSSPISDFGQAYDYASLMHYGSRAFSSNGKNTIEPRSAGIPASLLGSNNCLSASDIGRIRGMYKC